MTSLKVTPDFLKMNQKKGKSQTIFFFQDNLIKSYIKYIDRVR